MSEHTAENDAWDCDHHPTLCRTGRHGCWAHCHCGWRGSLWTTTVGAHLDFGQHLIQTKERA